MLHVLAWIFVAIYGLALLAGGVWLMVLGGSSYYALAGAAVIAVAVLLWLRHPAAPVVYAAVLAATALWALWETDGDGWALLPRLVLPAIIGLVVLLADLRRAPRGRSSLALVAVVVAALALPIVAFAVQFSGDTPASAAPSRGAGAREAGDWQAYGHDIGGSRFSPLTALGPDNVAGLKVAWTYRLGEVNNLGKGGLQTTPLKIADSLYLCSSFNDIIALNAETGRQRWRYNAHVNRDGVLNGVCRGVSYYRVPGASGPCAERIITNTVDARLIAVDRLTGRPCSGFGTNGSQTLLTGMGLRYPGYYYATSAPLVLRGKIIVGGWVTDNQYWGEPSGVIRAYDAVTGRFAWAMDVGRPNDHSEATAARPYTPSTPNSWGTMSGDEAFGLIYAPFGNPTPDYYGRQRRPFDEQIGSTISAIDVETGTVRWSFQTVHHDLWDYDIASQPVLADIPGPNGPIRALIQPTKRGQMFVLDRGTGKPILPVAERAVPQGMTAPGERLSPTQPYSVAMPDLAGPRPTERRMWGLTPIDQLWCRIRFKQARYDGDFTPPGFKPTITWPGYLGGTNWGSASFDPGRGRLVVNVSSVPNYTRIVPRAEADKAGVSLARPGVEGNFAYLAQTYTPFAAQTGPFLSPLGVPCTQPPFGTIAAVDMRQHRLAWSRRLGTARDSGPFGLSSHLPLPLGTPNAGGSIVTAGGLTFIGATPDQALRAYDTQTGRMLWEGPLPAGGQATPMTYRSPTSGRQFVVIAAGGNVWLNSRLGDYIVAFALPR